MKVHLFEQAVPPGALAAVCRDAHALADCKNFWVPRERIQQGPESCSTPAELAVCLLYQHVAQHLPDSWQGAEYWVQVYKPGAGLGFHFDKDEHLLKSTKQMVHPVWSSILYLTGSCGNNHGGSSCSSSCTTLQQASAQGTPHQQQEQQEQQQQQHSAVNGIKQQQQAEQQQQPDLETLQDWDGVRQAPTVILDQLFDQQQGCPVPSAPSRSMLVWPFKGTYCVFDGQLGHGVLDSCSSSIRATLLVNWWTCCPQSVEQLQDAAIDQQHLTRLDSSSIQQLTQHSTSSSTSTCQGAAQPPGSCCSGQQCDSAGNGSSDVAGQMASMQLSQQPIAGVATSGQQQLQEGSSALQQQPQHVQVQHPAVPVVAVAANACGEDEDSGMQLVDDVLARSKLSLVGPGAVSAVQFVHPGFVLCPIEDPSGSSDAAGGSNGGCAGSNGGCDGSSGGCADSSGPERLQTLGAFVSAELLGDDSSSCSSEDSSDAQE